MEELAVQVNLNREHARANCSSHLQAPPVDTEELVKAESDAKMSP
jgi:hypothetical protein